MPEQIITPRTESEPTTTPRVVRFSLSPRSPREDGRASVLFFNNRNGSPISGMLLMFGSPIPDLGRSASAASPWRVAGPLVYVIGTPRAVEPSAGIINANAGFTKVEVTTPTFDWENVYKLRADAFELKRPEFQNHREKLPPQVINSYFKKIVLERVDISTTELRFENCTHLVIKDSVICSTGTTLDLTKFHMPKLETIEFEDNAVTRIVGVMESVKKASFDGEQPDFAHLAFPAAGLIPLYKPRASSSRPLRI